MRHSYGAVCKNVRLRPLEKRDIEKLRVWRNDVSQTRFLRKIPEITPAMQENWYREYLQNEDEITFAIEETKELRRMVGSVALYNVRGEIAEIGKIQIGDPQAHGRGIGRVSMVMAMQIGFRLLGLKKIVISVHRENIAAYTNDLKVGFQIIGEHAAPMGGTEDEMEIDEKHLNEANDYAADIVCTDKDLQ